jgi:hypothetical protein
MIDNLGDTRGEIDRCVLRRDPDRGFVQFGGSRRERGKVIIIVTFRDYYKPPSRLVFIGDAQGYDVVAS